MRASGKGMWWNVEESEGRRNLNAPIVTMPRARKVTWGDIAALDIMKLFQLRLIAALMIGSNWTLGICRM